MKNLIIQYYIDTKLYDKPNFNGISSNVVEKYSIKELFNTLFD